MHLHLLQEQMLSIFVQTVAMWPINASYKLSNVASDALACIQICTPDSYGLMIVARTGQLAHHQCLHDQFQLLT